MARKTGDRNKDFDKKREQLLDALQLRLFQPDAARVSTNELAEAAGVSVSSLRHHLGPRAEIVRAVLQRFGRIGEQFTRTIAAPTTMPLAESLHWLMQSIVIGLRNGVLDVHALGLASGLRDDIVGPAYLKDILEPTLQCVEARLQHHIDRGELPGCDVRFATLALLSPLLLSAIHQNGLGGHALRPLSLDALCKEQVERFLRAYGPPAPASSAGAR